MSNAYWLKRDELFTLAAGKAESKLASAYAELADTTVAEMERLYAFIQKDNTVLVSDLYRYDKYYELMNNLNQRLNKLASKEIRTIEQSLTDMYFANTELVGNYMGFSIFPDEGYVKNVIATQWVGDGKIYSDRVWGHTALLQERVMSGLVECVVRGDTVDEVANRIKNEFNSGFYNAQRLIRTELSYIQNKSALDGCASAGYNYYTFHTVGDGDVCSTACEELDGKSFLISDAEAGINFPPIHPFVDAVLLAVLDGMSNIPQNHI